MSWGWPKAENRIRPNVIEYSGRVEACIQHTQEWVNIEDVCLDEGDLFRTGEGSFVNLEFGERGPVMRSEANSECKLSETGFEMRDDKVVIHIVVDLRAGSLSADLTRLPPGATFFVRTMHWVLRAEGGHVEAHEDGRVMVKAGRAVVDDPESGRTELRTGQRYK